MKFSLRLLLVSLPLIAIAISGAFLWLSPTSGHGGVTKHDLAFDGALAHFPSPEQGVSYSFGASFPIFPLEDEREFPEDWERLIGSAADIISRDTFFNRFYVGEKPNAGNILIYAGNWYDGFKDSSNRNAIRSLCGDPGRYGSAVCALPTVPVAPSSLSNAGTGFQLDWITLIENSTRDHFQGTVHLIFDKADVYPTTVRERKAVTPPAHTGLSDDGVKLLAMHGLARAIGHIARLKGEYGTNNILNYPPMSLGRGLFTFSKHDKWAINRLHMYSSDADVCKTAVDLASIRVTGQQYPTSGTGSLNTLGAICPSTVSNGLAHYYELNHANVDKRHFKVTTYAGSDVEQYVHNHATDPYKSGDDFVPYSPVDIGSNRLVQVASSSADTSQRYRLHIKPLDCVDEFTDFSVAPSAKVKSTPRSTAYLRSRDCLSSDLIRGYSDFYRLSVTADTAVAIDLESLHFDTYLYLRKGRDAVSGAAMASDDDSGNKHNARIVRSLTKGEYTIEATSSSIGAVGTYRLSVSSAGTAPTPSPSPAPTPQQSRPAAPAGFVASAGAASGSISLSWRNPGDSSITRYQYRALAPGDNWDVFHDVPNSHASATGYTITGLTPGVWYGIQLRAVNRVAPGSVSRADAPAGPNRP